MLAGIDFTRKFQGHEYGLTTRSGTWGQSRDACAAAGGALAVVTSPDEETFVRLQFGENRK